MSIASGGTIFVVVSDADNVLPSRTSPAARSSVFFISTVPSDRPVVSSACTNGIPPISNVPSTRANCATWYFVQISPSSGIRIFIRSSLSCDYSRRDQK